MIDNKQFTQAFYEDATKAITLLEKSINDRTDISDETKADIIFNIFKSVVLTPENLKALSMKIAEPFWQAQVLYGWGPDTTITKMQEDLFPPEVIVNNPVIPTNPLISASSGYSGSGSDNSGYSGYSGDSGYSGV